MTVPKFVLLILLVGALCGCNAEARKTAAMMTGGDPDRGKTTITQYGCNACHTIPGIAGANALVGPSLDQIASRSYIAGVLENTPENMIQWIQNPPAVAPKTAMPHLNVTEAEARDIAAYLYTLR
ncbi:MAG: c-type cytochrome [Limisphaerales bacterium]